MSFKRVGFFHFGASHGDPITSLKFELSRKKRNKLKQSLIVLPEPFNLVKYHPNPTGCREIRDFRPSVKFRLSKLAARFRVTFVAGLATSGDKMDPPYNAAYLIGGSSPFKLLARKYLNDFSNGRFNYTPSEGHEDFLAPRCVPGFVIGALICMDASCAHGRNDVMDRQKTLRRSMDALENHRPVLCVPARMGSTSSRAIAERWPGAIVIFANGQASLLAPSYIAVNTKVIHETSAPENRLCLYRIDASDQEIQA